MPTRTPLTDTEREQRRAADRAFVQQAVEALRSADGCQRWLATRRHFHTWSLLISRTERCWVDHARDSPTGLEAGQVFALGANSDGN
jgi:hypothetical protein